MSDLRPIMVVAMAISDEHLATLHTPGWTIDVVPPFGPNQPLEHPRVSDIQVLVSDVAPANLSALTGLRWLQLGSAGYMQVTGLPFEAMGVRVTNATGVNDIPIAEWCVLAMLAFERNLPELLRLQRSRGWDRRAEFQSELRGRLVGIIGYGGIGREVARQSAALGLEVWAVNRTPIGPTPLRFTPEGTGDPDGEIPVRTFAMNQLSEFLPHLDYLVITAALNPQTLNLLGSDELRLLPSHAVILNPARAQLIDEAALTSALREGLIAGAAIDSHYREPLAPDDPTWDLPNVLLTPHISGSTLSPHRESRLWQLVTKNFERFRQDQPLLNEVPSADLRSST